ncbi:MAG: glycosyltransferase [Oscillospiraceae bacterium]|nr:glycosyltransferase [Oscillospiraceae bacterium]
MHTPRILVGSPVCQKPAILRVFLAGLKQLESEGFALDFIFVDDNQEAESSRLLKAFRREGSRVTVLPAPPRDAPYHTDEVTQYWNDGLIARISAFKTHMMNCAVQEGYDFIFLIDSDLLVPPRLAAHLLSLNLDVVAEVMWAVWSPGPNQQALPSAWLYDKYDLARPGLPPAEYAAAQAAFLAKMRTPGQYEVGGLGACQMTRVATLAKYPQLRYLPISNLSLWGEDRWFCVRAAVLGVKLVVDTCCEPFHIYRESELAGIPPDMMPEIPPELI